MSAWMTWTNWFKRRKTVTTAAGRKRRVPDFADYGTAFGLDLSMTPEVPPTRAVPATDTAAVQAAVPVPAPVR